MSKLPMLFMLATASATAQTGVLTNRFDSFRTGWNATEQSLNTTNVKSTSFGKLFAYPVDGSVYAQPLYVPNVAIPGKGTHNVLYVVTMYDSVYAFDADQNLTLWQVSLINPAQNITPVPISDITGSNNLNLVGWVGIESTPVIDASSQTIYLVARTKEVTSQGTNYVQRLHALDLTTGAEKFDGPVEIAGSVPGTGEQSSNGQVPFDPFWQNQRAGLALANGQVIIIWASHEDDQPYHGWVMAYNATTLAQTGIFNDTPNGIEGGIWMSGRAPVVDSTGNVYLLTGNGTTDSKSDFGESALRLSTAKGGLALADYFTASNANSLNGGDEDLGASGPLMIPQTNLLVGGGKQGVLYLWNASSLGHYVPGDTQIPQKFQAVNNLIFSGPSYWQSASKGQLIYIWAMGDYLKAYHFNGSTFDTSPLIESTVQTPSGVDPGATLSISSSGTNDTTGVVWASMPLNADADHGLTSGILRAIEATSGIELWNTQMISSRDALDGSFAKFVPPTIANGKVYMATFTDYSSTNSLDVYGLITPSPKFTLAVTPASATTVPGSAASYTVSVVPTPGHSFPGTAKLSVMGLPAGASASFNPPAVTGAGTAVLTVATTASTPLGVSTLTITGKASNTGYTATAAATLTITDKLGAISVNFVGTGVALNPGDEAGVVPTPNWNNLTAVSSSTPVALNDEYGLNGAATVTWKGDNPWSLPITTGTPDFVMMQGYLDDGDGSTSTVTFAGLSTNPGGYSVYVYADGDNGSGARTATYTVSGPSVTTQTLVAADLANVNFSGTFVQVTASHPAGNYMVFNVPGGTFTLTATPKNAGPRAPINGIQVIPN